ncbi:unnamed protein product, partial [Mesorhabditis spiculigera]
MTATQKSGAVQALRALAIVAVIIFHLNSGLARNGFLGVDMFFVISGYLMTMILSKSGVTVSSTLTFLQRRIKRILPIYILTIASVLVAARAILVAKDLRILRSDAIWSLTLTSNMQPLFHEYDYFEELTAYKLLTHTWSLSAELQYYVFVPFVMLCMLAVGYYSRLLISLIVILASIGCQLALPPGIGFGLLPCRVWQFFFGLLVYEISQKRQSNQIHPTTLENGQEYKILMEEGSGDEEKEEEGSCERVFGKPSRDFSPFFCVATFALAIVICFYSVGNGLVDRILATFLAALVIYFSTNGATPVLDIWPIQYLGDISYILYLAHWPVIIFLKYMAFEETITLPTAILAILITVTIAVIIHHTMEQWFITGSFWYAIAWIGALLAISTIFLLLPINESDDGPEMNSMQITSNFSKNCKALQTPVAFPKLENFKVTLGGYEKYGEDSGNGSFNVVLLGNSFMRFGFPHFHKALKKRYKKLYFHAITSCMPFEQHWLTDPKQAFSKNCKDSYQLDLNLLEKAKPKIIFMSIGYVGGFITHDVTKDDIWIQRALESFEVYGKYADHIVLDTPWHKIPGRLADNIQKRITKGLPPLPKNETQFTFKDYLYEYRKAFKRVEYIRQHCPKCHFLEVQSEFCDGVHCQTMDYDCGSTFYTTDGIHMTNFAKNLLYHRLKAEIDIVYAVEEEAKKKRRR